MQALHETAMHNKPLIDLFLETLESTKDALIDAEGKARVARLQGRAEVLRDFLDALEKAPEVLSRLDKSQST